MWLCLFQGLQSVHGLTELIAYLVRLVINCFALICVIPTGLRYVKNSNIKAKIVLYMM